MNKDFNDDLTRQEELRVSGEETVKLDFNSSGDASKSISKYCAGKKVDLDAYIDSCPDDSEFDIKLDTNYSEHFNWSGVKPKEHITKTIKTNLASSTRITVSVHSNKPGTSATGHIKYSA